MKCPQCHAENADGKNFCSDCGTLLTPQLIPLIRFQVAEYTREHFKDQDVVEIKTAEAVADRLLKWAKLYYAIPVAVLIIILALFGISDYSDFHKSIRRATDEVKPKVDQAIAEADIATKKAQDAEAKAEEASKEIEAATAKMSTELASAQQLSHKVSGMESQTASQIATASKHVEDRAGELDKKVEAANKAIAEQQAKLTSTNELVTAMFSKGTVQMFATTQGDTSTYIVYRLPGASNGGIVFMLLKSAPIYQTIQIGFHVYVQPKTSYAITGNVIRFVWGESPDSLKQWPLEVSYVPDPTYRGPVYSTLSVKDGHVFADHAQLQ